MISQVQPGDPARNRQPSTASASAINRCGVRSRGLGDFFVGVRKIRFVFQGGSCFPKMSPAASPLASSVCVPVDGEVWNRRMRSRRFIHGDEGVARKDARLHERERQR